uniref:Uncharacterized protein n=1 Tax=Arundo donax TaxID=35708 RepID=A0A0A9DHW0_ARUDO
MQPATESRSLSLVIRRILLLLKMRIAMRTVRSMTALSVSWIYPGMLLRRCALMTTGS